MTKKQAEKRVRRMVASVHVLVAVVAIIECVLLMSFMTFSWIESNSSLVIQNGPESSQVNTNVSKKMDIAKQLNSVIDLNYTYGDNDQTVDPFAKLNSFFSEVKYFEFAQATSSDGRTLFFPCRNNTYSEAGKYRKADTIDYNTSFLYFDFVIRNQATDSNGNTTNGTGVENRDVYFDETEGFRDIFTVTGDGFSAQQIEALENAMRMSITTQVGSSAPSTKIFAKKAYSGSTGYKSIDEVAADQSYAYDENGGTGHTNNRNTWVETKELEKSVYHTTNNVIDADKLFVVKKNADTKVSVRIWFDVWDPDFRTQFGLDNLDYTTFESSDANYWKIPNATVGIKFRLKTNGNDLRSIYFDDYTLTNMTGIGIRHLTDENPNYKVWFYTWQPAVAATIDHPARTAGYYAIPLVRESSDATHTLWSANTATQSEMDYLMGTNDYTTTTSNASGYTGTVANRYTRSYFCYGDFSTKTAIYKWELPAAPVSEDFIFNAYSYMPNSGVSKTSHSWSSDSSGTTYWDCNGSDVRSGVGIWQDDAASTMTLLQFRDMATAVTITNYNGGSNFQIMNAQAALSHSQHLYLVYANNYNNATLANNFSSDVTKRTAAMYYDTSAQIFKSYVPTGWLTGNTGVSFTYCPGGVFTANGATLRWWDASPQVLGTGYTFTALGYSNRYNNDTLGGIGYTASVFNGSDGFLKGVGTWRDVEQISFSTELIDNLSGANAHDGGKRYFVGVSEAGNYSQGYYVMIPDASNMVFSAYIPSTQGSTTPGVNFVRMSTVKSSSANNTTGPSAYWYGNRRENSYGDDYTTFYPVQVVDTAASPAVYNRGYWNLSVLVDGTYENLIYDTLTDGAYDANDDPVSTYAPIVTPGTKTVEVNNVPTEVNHDSVDYTPRNNYGLLEYSYDGSDYITLADDTDDTMDNCLDRYRFYVPAEDQAVVYWRWTPYAGYTITFTSEGTSKTVNAAATQFEYTHDVTDATANGIYLVVTEAPSASAE